MQIWKAGCEEPQGLQEQRVKLSCDRRPKGQDRLAIIGRCICNRTQEAMITVELYTGNKRRKGKFPDWAGHQPEGGNAVQHGERTGGSEGPGFKSHLGQFLVV